jgi:hypothetical protein
MQARVTSMATGKAGLVLWLWAALTLAGGTVSAGVAQAQLPDAIAAPDAAPLLTLHAEGAQIYECKTASDGKLAWTFREPIASLMLDGRTVGRHFAGPTWEHVDGSAVQAKVVGNAPGATAGDIPWLKLEVIERRGSGALAGADIVQRINTAGGVLRGACEQAGALHSVPYSADYVFRRKDR